MTTFTRYLPHVARILFGLTFFVFGLNGFLQFLPRFDMPQAAGAFLGGIAASGYLMQLLCAAQVAAGALLLANRFVPLALAVLAPIVLNIFLFHIFLAPKPTGVITLALELYLAWSYRDAFRGMLRGRVAPHRAEARGEDARAAVQQVG